MYLSVDLYEAIDSIDHTILLQKLSCYIMKRHILFWFKSYLDNITEYVSCNNVNFKHMTEVWRSTRIHIRATIVHTLY